MTTWSKNDDEADLLSDVKKAEYVILAIEIINTGLRLMLVPEYITLTN